MSEYVTLEQAAEQLGVSLRTMQRYVSSGKVKVKKVDGKKLVPVPTASQVHTPPSTKPSKATEMGQTVVGEVRVLQESINNLQTQLLTLTKQLDVKDRQIDQLSVSVHELQTTQRLMIEKGMNLKELPSNTFVQASTAPHSAPIEQETVERTTRPIITAYKGVYALVGVVVLALLGALIYALHLSGSI